MNAAEQLENSVRQEFGRVAELNQGEKKPRERIWTPPSLPTIRLLAFKVRLLTYIRSLTSAPVQDAGP
jgi:hypothetical protein